MGGIIGNKINSSGLTALFDMQSPNCIVNESTQWKIYTPTGSTEFTVDANIYDSSTKSFKTTSNGDDFEIPKINENELVWGKTVSFYVKPSGENIVFDDTQ
jgi:hypothetical protein